ncbi:MAG: aminomethyl-transferring glycine dehydrogenase subunit GcvPA [Bacillota bacterium]
MRYIPNTDKDRREMLAAIGVGSVEELFSDIPAEVRFKGEMKLPAAMSEQEVLRHLRELGSRNASVDEYTCFLGAGAYDHFIPSVVGHVLARSEFYTAYTPYQPEVSQAVLQSIYEYQSLICALTGMDVANASMYDGASAVAEAALMAISQTRRERVVVCRSVHPESREVLKTYAAAIEVEVVEAPMKDGVTDLEALEGLVNDGTACVIAQHPNFFGCLEPVEEIARIVRKAKGLMVASVDPISLGILKPPAEYDADIVVGEGQSLGNPLSFGGPYLGFFAAREQFVRRMPGRIAGATVDVHGKRGFVLTLQTREQHIRRERATSNICSNEALNALAAAVYLSTMGKKGIEEVADLCLQKAHYLYDALSKTERFEPAFEAPFFKEFAVRCKLPVPDVIRGMLDYKILAGYEVRKAYPEYPDVLLVCVTEKRTRQEMDYFVARLEGLV